jgi:hypothetical protein
MLVAMFVLMPVLLMAMFGYMYPNVPKANVVEGTIPTAFPNLRLGLVRMDDSPRVVQGSTKWTTCLTVNHTSVCAW